MSSCTGSIEAEGLEVSPHASFRMCEMKLWQDFMGIRRDMSSSVIHRKTTGRLQFHEVKNAINDTILQPDGSNRPIPEHVLDLAYSSIIM